MSSIEPGRIVRIHSLTSAAGSKLNGQRAAVLRLLDNNNGRYECKVEFFDMMDPPNKTIAIEPNKLSVEERLPLPISGNRGNTMPGNDDMNQTLCELLLWYRNDYKPPETMFMGYAAMALMRMGQENFMYFTGGQMEQMGAVLALANICQQAQEPATCDALFAILQGDTMYMEVIAQTLYWTGFIGPEDACTNENEYMNCPPTRLTPDQDEAAYCRVMNEGPLLLMREMSKYKLGMAFFAGLRKCQFYHLVVQRLLRLTAREALKTSDGKALGKKARAILGDGILGDIKIAPVSETTAMNLLETSGTILVSPEAATNEAIKGLLQVSERALG